MIYLELLLAYAIFPGFLFSACIGLLSGWVDRKVSARIQYRQGPPWHQNFTDILKLFGKETIVPQNAQTTFLLAPYLGLLGLLAGTAILGGTLFYNGEAGFTGDLILVIYLMTIPAIALVIGASGSANPLASVGASRELKLLLAYELPFILSVVIVIIKSGGAIRLDHLLAYQASAGSTVFSVSGAIAFVVAILCAQAKLGLVPFDMAEADQELMCGTLIEYSGWALALVRLTKAVLLTTVFFFIITLFLGKDISPLFLALKFIALLVIAILIKNTNPRLRIDQALRFFWGPVTAVAVIGLILAARGL